MYVSKDALAPAQPRLVLRATGGEGACFFTGSSVGPFFDTDVDVDDETVWGRLYVSTVWVESRARELGWKPGARVAELEAQLAALGDRLRATEAKLAEFEDLAAVLAKTAAALPNTVVISADELARERLARQGGDGPRRAPLAKPSANMTPNDLLDIVPTALDFVLEADTTAEARQRALSLPYADLPADERAAIEQFLLETEDSE